MSGKVVRKDKCKLCNHRLRLEIEIQKLVLGRSLRDLEEYAKTNDFDISYVAIKRHFDNHMDEKREVQVRYIAEKRRNEEMGINGDEVGVKLKELKNLDAAIHESTELMKAASLELKRQLNIKIPRQFKMKDENGKDTGKILTYDKVEVSHSVVQLFKGAAEEIRQSAKAKMEILGIDKKSKRESENNSDSIVEAIMRLTEE
jgi:hypothetical protein